MREYDTIEKAILQNDIIGLREAVGIICYMDKDFSTGEFDEVVEYILQRGIQLKDSKLNGKLVSETKKEYTEDDFVMAVFELKNNFCDERIRDVKKIGRSLYKKRDAEQTESINYKEKVVGKDPNVQSHQKPIYLIAIGVVLVAIVGLVLLLR